jgi:hypothetical protein
VQLHLRADRPQVDAEVDRLVRAGGEAGNPARERPLDHPIER